MNGTPGEALSFLAEMKDRGSRETDADLVFFPPFTLLPLLAESGKEAGIELGGQDLFWMDRGAYTGEISPGMLMDAGAGWFIAGHSERRHVIGETDDVVRKKLEKGLESGLKGILCVGELVDQRERGLTEKVVRRQLESALDGLDIADASNLVVAYEPVWAIGTGLTATPDEAQRMHSLIREWVGEIGGGNVSPEELRILYGGSVKPGNAADILSKTQVNGALVGGASLRAESFSAIVTSIPAEG